MKKRILTLTLMLVVSSQTLFAGGFDIPLQSIKIVGIGNMGTALAWDASSLYYNPANISFLENEWDIVVGAQALLPAFAFKSNVTNYKAEVASHFATPVPHLYVTYHVNDKLTVGLSANAPFGSALDWGKDFIYAPYAYKISLVSFFAQPTVAYKITDNISVGAGFTIGYGTFELNRTIPIVNGGELALTGQSVGYGANAGVSYQSDDGDLNVSFNYKWNSSFDSKNGEGKLTNIPSALSSAVPSGTASAGISLPQSFSIGAMKKFGSLTVVIGGSATDWTSFKNLSIEFTDEEFATNPNRISETNLDLGYAYTGNIGVQYDVMENLAVRAGFIYDKSPIPTDKLLPILPIGDLLNYTAGVTYKINDNFDIDANFLYVQGLELTGSHSEQGISSGTYKSVIPSFGLGIAYHF